MQPVTEDLSGKEELVYNMDAAQVLLVQNAHTINNTMKKVLASNTTLYPMLEEQHKNNKRYVKAGEKTYMLIYRTKDSA